MLENLSNWLRDSMKGAGSALLSAAIAYAAVAWTSVPLDEPFKSAVALAILALWNRLRGEQA